VIHIGDEVVTGAPGRLGVALVARVPVRNGKRPCAQAGHELRVHVVTVVVPEDEPGILGARKDALGADERLFLDIRLRGLQVGIHEKDAAVAEIDAVRFRGWVPSCKHLAVKALRIALGCGRRCRHCQEDECRHDTSEHRALHAVTSAPAYKYYGVVTSCLRGKAPRNRI
jgi:hypothetical protein